MNKIQKLSEATINRIAAGEVVERPSSVIKELIENSIDAGSSNIQVSIDSAGKNLIIISDNGVGMGKEDILLAIERHTTSKLNEDDINDITFFGFRGEALPSIASVSNMKISSRKKDGDGYFVNISAGKISDQGHIIHTEGTRIEVRDLFFATPVRLKFLKSDKTEISSCLDIIKRISLAHPEISFSLSSAGKEIYKVIKTNSNLNRIKEALGSEFTENASEINLERYGYYISGYTSIPTYNKSTSSDQYLFVNNRPVKDKLLNIALKVAYQDYLSRDRHPVSVIFIITNPKLVDVNVHPAKTEVRFRDSNEIRGLLISAVRDSLQKTSSETSTHLSDKIFEIASQQSQFTHNFNDTKSSLKSYSLSKPQNYSKSSVKPYPSLNKSFDISPNIQNKFDEFETHKEENIKYKMGAAACQVHNTYIISQTEDGLFIVDQHAAHERLTYEKLKLQLLKGDLPTQRLLIPTIVEFIDEFESNIILEKLDELKKFGLAIQKFGEKSIYVTEVPAILGEFDVHKLIRDLVSEFKDLGENIALQELIEHVTETYACHYSIRAGRSMSISEMNDLLREMENTPFSGQCNHGRPTYIRLSLNDIEKLFGRR